LVEKGTVLIVVEPDAEEIVLQAIKKAYEERGVKVQMVPQHELAGVNKEEARKAKGTARRRLVAASAGHQRAGPL
jgi:hypothetical protein